MNAPGKRAEDAAADFLQKNGFEILARNFTVRGAEIDIVATGKGVHRLCRSESIFHAQRCPWRAARARYACQTAAYWHGGAVVFAALCPL